MCVDAEAYQIALDRCVEILIAVQGTLDVRSEICGECNCEKRSNWREFQAAQALEGAITRVRKATGLITTGTTFSSDQGGLN